MSNRRGWGPAGAAATVVVGVSMLLLSGLATAAPGPGGHALGSTPAVRWHNLTASRPINPGAVGAGGFVYDAVDHYALYFGGQRSGYSGAWNDNQTWAYNGSWTNLTATVGRAPSPRAVENSIAYDPADGYVLLFGGKDMAGNGLGDTWTFSGGRWTNITSSLTTSPSPRLAANMAYDPGAGGVLLFGGSSSVVFGSATFYNDTWLFSKGAWTQLFPVHAPSPRRDAGMAYDPTEKAVVLFGGTNSGTPLGGTWLFKGGDWRPSAAVSPPAAFTSSLVYDPAIGGDVVFGGCTSSGCATTSGLTWLFIHGGWQNGTLYLGLKASPSSRGSLTGTYYPPAKEYLIYGGHLGSAGTSSSPSYYVDELWALG
ncbi:MAG TPA: hypothetical protein VMH78_03050 [Thermoplasmata archaeon]|nr:hypothetical protein [Thermoplasmata archaeon]